MVRSGSLMQSAKAPPTSPKGIGYFMNLLGKINSWIDRENKRGADIPRFTKVQIRRIALYLENHYLFNFNALRKAGSRWSDHVRVKRVRLEGASMTMGRTLNDLGVLEADTGPAPVKGRSPPSLGDQVREFKRIVSEQNKDLPSKIIDDMLL